MTWTATGCDRHLANEDERQERNLRLMRYVISVLVGVGDGVSLPYGHKIVDYLYMVFTLLLHHFYSFYWIFLTP